MRKALLVEDEALVAMIAAEALSELGFEVIEARSAKMALEFARADLSDFQVAVIDLGLPDRPGDTLVADLKALRSDLPIIVASGNPGGAQDVQFSAYSNVVVLSKPYDFAGLSSSIQALGLI